MADNIKFSSQAAHDFKKLAKTNRAMAVKIKVPSFYRHDIKGLLELLLCHHLEIIKAPDLQIEDFLFVRP